MGLLYNDETIWSKKEKDFLRKNYHKLSLSELSKLFGRSERAICSIACKLQISKIVELNYKNPTSKYKYVSWQSSKNKWAIRFRHDGKVKYFGYYDDEDEAGKVAMEKAKEYGKVI